MQQLLFSLRLPTVKRSKADIYQKKKVCYMLIFELFLQLYHLVKWDREIVNHSIVLRTLQITNLQLLNVAVKPCKL